MLKALWISAAVVALDQVSKQVVQAFMAGRSPVEITPFLDLVLAYNRGAAFSFLNTAGGWQKYLFLGVAVVAVVVCLRMLRNLKPGETQMALALSLVIGGAVGNAIDRALFGHVIDFILLHYRGWAWPAFNVADSAITVGAVLLILDAVGIRLIGARGRSRHLPT